ncbi:MAG: two-component regulator propeller domain-containing protein [Ignavibacteriaceae bacterium]
MKTYLPLFFILFLFSTYNTLSANPEWITYTFGEEIYTMVDDGNILWLGTDGGLVKFNKLSEEKVFYNKANTNNGLMDNHIRALAIDTRGNLWVGTAFGGISKFNGETWQNFTPGNSPLPDASISCIGIDKSNRVYIGSGIYLVILDDEQWTSLQLGSQILSFFTFINIEFDSRNRAWIATKASGPGGLFLFQDNEITRIENDTIGYINSLKIDEQDNIWCGSSILGLLKFNGNYFEQYDTTNSNTPSNDIYISNIDKDNYLWCTSTGSVWRYNKDLWFEYKPDIFLSPNNIFAPRTIICDESDMIWIATWGTGLLKYNGIKWKRYKTSSSGLINNFLNLIATDDDGKVWISFLQPCDSVLCFDGKNWTFYRKEDYLFWSTNFQLACYEDSIQIWKGKGILIEFFQGEYNWAGVYNIKNYRHGNHIKIDKTGNIWQVSSKRGLWRYSNKWEFFNFENTPINFNITGSIAFDESNSLYATSDAGIIKYTGTNWELYPKEYFLLDTRNTEISSLEIDRHGNLWLGTCNDSTSDDFFGEGLIKYDGHNITRYNYNNSPLPNAPIYALHFDSNDTLWIGTEASGLIRFDSDESWIIYNSNNSGISSEYSIAPLEVDIHNNVWFKMWWGGLGVFHEGGIITDVIQHNDYYNPELFTLYQNYPNPFNPSTQIKYGIPSDNKVSIKIYNVLGKEIAVLVNNEIKTAGWHQTSWNSEDINGNRVSSGIYFCRIFYNSQVQTIKLMLVK